MKITKKQLKQIIKEELQAALSEQSPGGRINAPKITQDLMSLYKDYKNTEKYVSGPMPNPASQEYGYFMQSEEQLSDLRSKLATMLQDPDTLRALQATGKTKEAQAIQQDLAASAEKDKAIAADTKQRLARAPARKAVGMSPYGKGAGGYRLE